MAKARERGRRDMAGVGPDPTHTGGLVRIDDLDGFKVASGEPDVRGWDVCTLSGAEVGEVDDLLVDPRRGEVVMLEIDIKGSGRHAEVPVRSVQLDRDRKVVIVDSSDVAGDPTVQNRSRLSDDERVALRDTYGAVSNRDVRYDLRDNARGPESDEARLRAYEERERALEQRERELLERERKLAGPGGLHGETVVGSRPIVVEETVVRRRNLRADGTDTPDTPDRTDGTL
jgi:hypothetical protein